MMSRSLTELPIVIRFLEKHGDFNRPGLPITTSIQLLPLDKDIHGLVTVVDLCNLVDNLLKEECKSICRAMLDLGYQPHIRQLHKVVHVGMMDGQKKYTEVTDKSLHEIVHLVAKHGIMKHRLEVHYLVKSEVQGRKQIDLFGGKQHL